MTFQESLGMVAAFPELLKMSGQSNPAAYAEDLSAEELVTWILERTAFDFRKSIVGHENGFLYVSVRDSVFVFGVYGFPYQKGSFAAFILIEKGLNPDAARNQVQNLIAGGSILMRPVNVAEGDIPPEILEIVTNGVGLPLSV